MTDVTKPVTLADLERDGKLAWVYCNACGRERDLRPPNLGLPMETPVPEAGKRLVCSACGGRSVTVKPELYPGGVEAIRRRHCGGLGAQERAQRAAALVEIAAATNRRQRNAGRLEHWMSLPVWHRKVGQESPDAALYSAAPNLLISGGGFCAILHLTH